MRYSTLIIYTLVYFANIFLYTIYLIFVLFICSVTTIIVALSVVIVGTTFQLITTLETGIRVSDFFVISTVLNTALILCVVLVLCCTI